MNREELKLSLVDVFSKAPPVKIEYTRELFDLFRQEFWSHFKTSLEIAIKEGQEKFGVNKMCVNWWSSRHPIYLKYKDTSQTDRYMAFAAFQPIIAKELEEIGIPFELKEDYPKQLKYFEFTVAKLRDFSNVARLGSLK